MNHFLKNEDAVSICHKDNCVHARGENAEIITAGVFTLLLCVGVAALAKALS